MAALLGRSTWKTRLDVWQVKTGRVTFPVNEAMGWGLLLEPVILQEYGRRTGQVIVPGNFKVHDKLEFIGGSADAFARPANSPDGKDCPVATIDNPDGLRLIECKTAGAASRRNWERGIPFDYQCQAQLYLALHGLELCTFVVLFGGHELVTYDLPADPMLQHAMLVAAEKFWVEHIQTDIPPAPSVPGWDDLTEATAERGPVREATTEVREALLELVRLREERSNIERQEEALGQWLQEFAPDGAIAHMGKELAGWQTKTRKATVLEAKTWKQFAVKPSSTLRKILDATIDTPTHES